MSRWISVDDAVNALCKGCGWYEEQCDNDKGFWCEARGLIEEATHIDIVKCGECKHRYADTEQRGCIKNPTQFWKADDYCSYGERRE